MLRVLKRPWQARTVDANESVEVEGEDGECVEPVLEYLGENNIEKHRKLI
jgi:hypothetical protein